MLNSGKQFCALRDKKIDILQAVLMLFRVKSMLSCMKSDICFWKWGFDKVFWNFISEVSSHIYCLGNGISVDVT
jgi:hypothetical protein